MTALRQRMLEDMQVRNFSPHTQSTYVLQVAQFARHFQQSPEGWFTRWSQRVDRSLQKSGFTNVGGNTWQLPALAVTNQNRLPATNRPASSL